VDTLKGRNSQQDPKNKKKQAASLLELIWTSSNERNHSQVSSGREPLGQALKIKEIGDSRNRHSKHPRQQECHQTTRIKSLYSATPLEQRKNKKGPLESIFFEKRNHQGIFSSRTTDILTSCTRRIRQYQVNKRAYYDYQGDNTCNWPYHWINRKKEGTAAISFSFRVIQQEENAFIHRRHGDPFASHRRGTKGNKSGKWTICHCFAPATTVISMDAVHSILEVLFHCTIQVELDIFHPQRFSLSMEKKCFTTVSC
jgi:hypothetical protein